MQSLPSPNCDKRPDGTSIDTLVIHYTDLQTCQEALDILCNPEKKVSSHYLIDEDGSQYELVKPEFRAWHAGKSIWLGKENVNDFSIGIELANPGHSCGYREFPEAQMVSLIELCKKLTEEFPIESRNIIAHSDIAPSRKRDPGELFDWELLAKNGLGIWVNSGEEDEEIILQKGDRNDAVRDLQTGLARYGYGIVTDGKFEEQTEFVVQAFERHFGNSVNVTGKWTKRLDSTLEKLLTAIS